jgi:hypothetical protein
MTGTGGRSLCPSLSSKGRLSFAKGAGPSLSVTGVGRARKYAVKGSFSAFLVLLASLVGLC